MWWPLGQEVEDTASDAPAAAKVVPFQPCPELTAISRDESKTGQGQAPATQTSNGQVQASAGEIDVDMMRKNDILQFIARNKIELPGLGKLTIQKMRKALKIAIQDKDAPDGGWKMPETDRP